jgi:translation initiation factor IF-3
VRVGAKIADYDLDRQLKLAQDFLSKGYKVKLLVTFLRRDVKLGVERIKLVRERAEAWANVANPGANDKIAASTFAVMLTPLSVAEAREAVDNISRMADRG